jgi:molecular chaperone DnaK
VTAWELGIDFGTSYTVAAIAQEGNVTVIDVESSGKSRIPSSVFLNPDGRILVGTSAQHQAAFTPERYEPTPKRSFGEGEIFLGDRLVAVTDLAAAVIHRVYAEATRQQGETAPAAVRITHPANWSETRLAVLNEAVEKAGVGSYEPLPEPVAAAARIGLLATRPSEIVAVYDFGGGTFDAAVLRRTEAGFEVAGRPTGRDPLGGEDIDRHIVEHLSTVLAAGHEQEWSALLRPTDAGSRRRANELRAEVQRAKETLSEASVCQLWIPGLERDAQLTRAELDRLIAADVESTVDTLQEALGLAGVEAKELSGLYMVGGSSRIPLVADALWRRLGVRPEVQENPKSIVAMGAAGWSLLTQAAQAARRQAAETARRRADVPAGPHAPSPTAGPPAPPSAKVVLPTFSEVVADSHPRPQAGPEERPFDNQLVMAVDRSSWPSGCRCVADIEIDRPGTPPTTVRARDEPSDGASTEWRAQQIGDFRAQRTPGYVDHGAWPYPVLGQRGIERRFRMAMGQGTVEMFEQYLVVGDRALVIACPMAAREVADGISHQGRPSVAGEVYRGGFSLRLPAGWAASERLTLRRNGTGHTVVSRRTVLPPTIGAAAWRRQQIDELAAPPGASIISVVAGPVLNHFDGEVATAQWVDRGVAMLTKRGLAVFEGVGYTMTIVLPAREQAAFPALARQARLAGPPV